MDELKVEDFMHLNPVVLKSDASVIEAIKLLEEHNFRHLPIVDDENRVIGIVSDRDIKQVRVAIDLFNVSLEEAEEEIVVADIMTRNVITVSPDTLLQKAAEIMMIHKIGALPVVESDKIIGIITETDLLKALVWILEEE